jgi:hypothetical protein
VEDRRSVGSAAKTGCWTAKKAALTPKKKMSLKNRRNAPPAAHIDAGAGLGIEPLIVGPDRGNQATISRNRRELEERIGSDAGVEIGSEDLNSVVLEPDRSEKIPRHNSAVLVMPKPIFHGVLGERLNLDHLTTTGRSRGGQQQAQRQTHRSSVQADKVTSVSAEVCQNDPSLMTAIAQIR